MRPEHINGRPGLFTPEQVRAWRAEWARRKALRDQLATLPTVADMAKKAGVQPHAMRQLLTGANYKWVR